MIWGVWEPSSSVTAGWREGELKMGCELLKFEGGKLEQLYSSDVQLVE